MALTVEDGSIVTGANSYAAIATADDYHADRNNLAWAAATSGQKTAAILNATAYLDGKYRLRFRGNRVQPVLQPLEWPRIGVDIVTGVQGSAFEGRTYYSNYPSDQIPAEIVSATCELALRALSGPLAADIAPRDRVRRKSIAGAVETEYVPGDFQTSYPVVEQLISRYLKSSSDAVRG